MLLSCRNIKKSFGDQIILNGVDLDVCQGDRIGLVGRNGDGKTTLANILCAYKDYNEGSIITTRKHLNIGYLQQQEAESELFINVINSETELSGDFQRLTGNLGMKRVKDWPRERLQNLSGGEKNKDYSGKSLGFPT